MTTISASSTIGIELNPASYTSPVVIGGGVTISNHGYADGLYKAPVSTTIFTIQNDGTITASSTVSGVGVYLAPGGSVTNATTGKITGGTGVKMSGSAGGSVINAASASII